MSKDGLHFEFDIRLQLKPRDEFGGAVVVFVDHVNELVLDGVVWVESLLDEFLHSVDDDHSHEHLPDLELPDAGGQSLGELCILRVVLPGDCQLHANLVLLCLALQVLHRLLAVDVVQMRDFVFTLKQVLLQSEVLILAKGFCQGQDQGFLVTS